mgnify:CR=1 FL=1|jgi:hypothetical protein
MELSVPMVNAVKMIVGEDIEAIEVLWLGDF